VSNLAFMAAQCGQLQMEGVRYVGAVVDIFRPPEQYLLDLAAIRVSGYHNFWLIYPYQADELLAELGCILQALIRMT